MNILAIDPGPEKSAWIVIEAGEPKTFDFQSNEGLRNMLALCSANSYNRIGIEMVACFGMPVGAEVFQTAYWIGRFCERSPIEPELIYRKDVKMHFCHSMRAKDANVRQAILDRFGGKDKAIGKKGCYGPLRSVKGHLWSALAVALFVADTSPVPEVTPPPPTPPPPPPTPTPPPPTPP